MKHTTIFLLFFCSVIVIFCFITNLVFAQSSVSSNCVTTNVGTGGGSQLPSNCLSGSSGSSGSSNSIVKVASDLVDSNRFCNPPNGYIDATADSAFQTCVVHQMILKGYSSSQMQYITPFSNYSDGLSPPCAECIGFVRMVLDLALQTDNNQLDGHDGGDPVKDKWGSFVVGNHTFTDEGNIPQPGDVGVATEGEEIESAGHILIVKNYDSGGLFFTALESNWYSIPNRTCWSTNDVQHPRTFYHFFRQTS